MKLVLAQLACVSVLAVALITLALAQSPTQKNNSGASKAAIVDSSAAQGLGTVQNLVSARDYRPPQGIAFKAADFISENVRLTAQWFYAAENKGRKLPTIIIAHGWGTTAANFRQDAIDLASAGYLVMLFDYRGWGDSDGRVMKTSNAQVRELRGYIDPWEQVNDWFNTINYAVTDPMVDAARIGILGSDLSGGHVIYVAAHEPRVKALVSEVSSVECHWGVRRETGKEQMVKVHYSEGVANRTDLESCVVHREVSGEALTKVWVDGAGSGVRGYGVCQRSCRVGHFDHAALAAMIFSGLSITSPIGCQLRVAPDQRSGRLAFAVSYTV